MRVKLFCSSSAFCQENLGGKCAQAGMERVRSGLVKKPRSIRLSKISEIQIEMFGRMERAQSFLNFEKMARTRTTTKVVYVLEDLRIDLC